MINIYNRIPIKYSIRLRSLVQHTGLLVSIWICLMLPMLTGCGDKAMLYEIDDVNKAETVENAATEDEPVTASAETLDAEIKSVTDDNEQMLVVFLCGAVNNPGVYELKADSRIIDGINKAGGFTEDASIDALNLAMEVSDGSRIYVPTTEEVSYATEGDDAFVRPDMSDRYISDSDGLSSGNDGKGSVSKVNINTADETLLTSLSGIGPNRAKAIITYREEHGGFGTIEELMNVSGIGQASFDKLKDDITI